ncbi:uncharacterized protein LOC110974876 [Acanthaster planci]|uniref:Uncharacterized protein LOC110974876 n=1 Tax=Acanthaster planci TaxID=133434 RepID=A0A8B7XNV4_ACAPL|nr:uncharacterized protein LOC110974876 [Acanthaster planci]
MASSHGDKRELSFSEWCDKQFTNMYSHQEFVSSQHQSVGETSIKARLQVAPKQSEDNLGHKGHKRVGPVRSFSSQGTNPRSTDEAELQAAKSPSLERWPKFPSKVSEIEVSPSGIKWCNQMNTLSVSNGLLAAGSTPDAENTGVAQLEERKNLPKNQGTNNQRLKRSIGDGSDKIQMMEKHVSKVSVDCGSSGQESHTSKRTFSELSPGRKHTKGKKGKKRMIDSGRCPRKPEDVQHEDKQWKEDRKSASLRSQAESLPEKEQHENKEGRMSKKVEWKSTKGNTDVKVKYCKDCKKSQSGKVPEDEAKRVPSGKYDVELSAGIGNTEHELHLCTNEVRKTGIDDRSQRSGEGEKVAKVDQKTSGDKTSKLHPNLSSCDKSASGSSSGKSMERAKGHNSQRRMTDVENLRNTGTQLGEQKEGKKLSASPDYIPQQCRVTRPEGRSSVKSMQNTKGASIKDVQEKATEGKIAGVQSPSPRDKPSVAAHHLTKRVLESVLKPLCSSRSATKLRPKSGESAKTSRCTDQTRQMQRRSPWSATKVHLEHIYQAFGGVESGTSAEEEQSIPSADKESEAKARNECWDNSHPECPQDRRQLQEFLHEKTQHQEEADTQPQTASPRQMLNKDGKMAEMECCTAIHPPISVNAKVDSGSSKSDGPLRTVNFAPKFTPRTVSRITDKVKGDNNNSGVTSEKSSEDVARSSVTEKTQTKNDYIARWLENQDEPPQKNSFEVSTNQNLEPSEVSDSTSTSDEAWEQLVDSIMKGNDEEVFSSPYSKRVQQKWRTAGLVPVTPFQTGSLPMQVDFKPTTSVGQKNVATVSPYCIRPPAPQPTRSSACTWSGPMPGFRDGNKPLTPASPPFYPLRSVQGSLDGSHDAMGTMDSLSSFLEKQECSEKTPAKVLWRSPGEYPGKEDMCLSPTVMHTDAVPASSKTQKVQSMFNIPPRFLRLAQLKADKDQPVSVRMSSRLPSGSGCVYPKQVRQENLVSTSEVPTCTSAPQSASPSMVGTPSKSSYRSWISSSLGWSTQSLSRTPGTITPTRFTPWASRASPLSREKPSYHIPRDTVELSPVVDYPICSVPYVDTHCHIDFLYQRTEFSGTFEKFSKVNNFPQNYAGCLAVFCTPEGFEQGALWEDLVKEKNIWLAFGCHPHHAKSYDGIVEENIIRCMRHPKAIALGEIGLDYSNRCTSDRPLQLEVFRRQLHIALQMGKPLVIHSRDAEQDTLSVMKEMVPRNYKIHRHCFTGSPQEARNFFQAFPNSFIGLTALVTFPTAYPVHRTATEVPLSKILLETDAPYFLPKQCPRTMRWANPSMAVFVAVRIAQLRGLTLEDVLYAVRRNTTEMYESKP